MGRKFKLDRKKGNSVEGENTEDTSMKEGKKVSGRGSLGRVGKSAKPERSRNRAGEDHHARVWTRENYTQEELMRLVPKESRLRPVYRGKVNSELDEWYRLLRSRYE
jgi:hypothetical protein